MINQGESCTDYIYWILGQGTYEYFLTEPQEAGTTKKAPREKVVTMQQKRKAMAPPVIAHGKRAVLDKDIQLSRSALLNSSALFDKVVVCIIL